MTVDQMNYEFEVGYDRITNFDAPGYEPKEISTFLTKAQEEVVFDIISNNAYKEFNKKVLNMLKTKSESSTVTAGPYPNSFWRDLPTHVLYVINDRVDLLGGASHFYSGITFSDVAVKPVDDDYYSSNKENPYKKPTYKLAWRLDYSELDTIYKRRHVYVIGENLTISNTYVHYYRKAEPIIVKDSEYIADDGAIDGVTFNSHTSAGLDCELDPIIHREIVDRAIKLAYASLIDEKGFQISSIKEQQNSVEQ